MGSKEEVLHSLVREQRAAYRAIRAAIDGYFLRGDDGPRAVDALGKQIDLLLRYAQAVAGVISQRRELGDRLEPEETVQMPKDLNGKSLPDEVVEGGGKVDRQASSDGVDELDPFRLEDKFSDTIGDLQWKQQREQSRTEESQRRIAQRSPVDTYREANADVSVRRKPLKSLEKGMTINDRLYFRQELCGGDAESFKALLAKMDAAGSVETAMRILEESRGEAFDADSEGIKRFLNLLEQRYGS